MGFWQKINIFKGEKAIQKTSRTKEDFSHNIFDEEGGSATFVNAKDFLNLYKIHPWIYSSIFSISTAISQLPITIKELKDGKYVVMEEEEIITIFPFFRKANPDTSWSELIEKSVIYLELLGEFIWEIVLTQKKDAPAELYNLRPDRIKIDYSKINKERIYNYSSFSGREVTFLASEVLHISHPNPLSDFKGQSAIEPTAVSLIADFYAKSYNQSFFKNSARLSGVLNTEQELSDDGFTRVKTEWKRLYSGTGKAHGVAVLDKGLKYDTIQVAPKDTEFQESGKNTREEILASIGVPPVLVGVLEDASYANALIQSRLFWENTILPRLHKIEFGINDKIISIKKDKKRLFSFDISNVRALKDDLEIQAKIDNSYVRMGVHTINEVRATQGLPAVAWGDEDPRIKMTSQVQPTEKRDEGSGSFFLTSKTRRDENDFEVWKAFIGVGEKLEKEYIPKWVSLFEKQEQAVLYKIELLEKITSQADIEDIEKTIKIGRNAFVSLAKKMINVSVENGWLLAEKEEETIKHITIEKQSDSFQDITDYISTQAGWLIKQIEETTRSRLRKELTESYNLGESIDKIRARVQGVFEGTVREKKYRAENIARTEIIGSSNRGKLMRYKAMDNPTKTWIATFDDRVRPSHLQANNQTVLIDDDFAIGGVKMEYPGDPKGGAENVCQCRCTMRSRQRR
ncbi:MAG: phage portal protein [Proteobacteria bacterium]|nr:phage portal protein [Pseudomonadota bacterium]